MDTLDWTSATPVAPADLPPVVTGYLAAQRARDADAALAHLHTDAVVVDDGHTYAGHDAIRAWIGGAASEYTYTTEVVGAAAVDADHLDVVHHLEGDFPGGVVDLHHRVTLRDGSIARVVIEP